jgi:hypothetical protein
LSGGGGVGADCAGYPYNGFRYDTPTWAGFSVSTGYYEDDVWDVAVKYAADWNSVKFSAAVGYTQLTDEGCGNPNISATGCTNGTVLGGGGAPNQNYRKDAQIFQAGASVMHVPSGLFVYGLYQREENDGTQWKTLNFNTGNLVNSAANENDVWYVKAGIKRTWMPAGATVLFGEYGRYEDQFTGLCALPSGATSGTGDCSIFLPTSTLSQTVVVGPTRFVKGTAVTESAAITGSEVTRWGIGVVQEIDSAAMHVFARWQHLDLDLNATSLGLTCLDKDVTTCVGNNRFGKKVNSGFDDLEIFQIGGVIFF